MYRVESRLALGSLSTCEIQQASNDETHITGGTVHGVSSSDHLPSRPQDVLERTLGALLDLVDPKDRTNVDSGVDVTASVKRIESNTVVADQVSVRRVGPDHNSVFLRNNKSQEVDNTVSIIGGIGVFPDFPDRSKAEKLSTHPFFRDQHGTLSTRSQRVDHDLVTQDIQLLLLLSLDVLGTSQTDPVHHDKVRV